METSHDAAVLTAYRVQTKLGEAMDAEAKGNEEKVRLCKVREMLANEEQEG
jgi:hypothetical protein